MSFRRQAATTALHHSVAYAVRSGAFATVDGFHGRSLEAATSRPGPWLNGLPAEFPRHATHGIDRTRATLVEALPRVARGDQGWHRGDGEGYPLVREIAQWVLKARRNTLGETGLSIKKGF